jgi:hypothetical protein
MKEYLVCRKLTFSGLVAVVADLRPADVREAMGWGAYKSPAEAVAKSADWSYVAYEIAVCRAGDGTDTIAVWGANLGGSLWFVARPCVSRYAKTILKSARHYLVDVAREIGEWELRAVADPRNTLHAKWLRAVGFKKVADVVTPGGLVYHEMVINVHP